MRWIAIVLVFGSFAGCAELWRIETPEQRTQRLVAESCRYHVFKSTSAFDNKSWTYTDRHDLGDGLSIRMTWQDGQPVGTATLYNTEIQNLGAARIRLDEAIFNLKPIDVFTEFNIHSYREKASMRYFIAPEFVAALSRAKTVVARIDMSNYAVESVAPEGDIVEINRAAKRLGFELSKTLGNPTKDGTKFDTSNCTL